MHWTPPPRHAPRDSIVRSYIQHGAVATARRGRGEEAHSINKIMTSFRVSDVNNVKRKRIVRDGFIWAIISAKGRKWRPSPLVLLFRPCTARLAPLEPLHF